MSRSTLTSALLLGLAIAPALAGCDRQAEEPTQGSTASPSQSAPAGTIDRGEAGALMPAVNVSDPAGDTLNLGALQGAPVLVNLWATWCAPCVKEMPLLNELAADYDGRLRVVTISQDLDAPDKVKAFMADNDLTQLDPWLDPKNAVSAALGGANLPTTVLYDAGGREVWRVAGDYDWSSEEARAAIDEAIG